MDEYMINIKCSRKRKVPITLMLIYQQLPLVGLAGKYTVPNSNWMYSK